MLWLIFCHLDPWICMSESRLLKRHGSKRSGSPELKKTVWNIYLWYLILDVPSRWITLWILLTQLLEHRIIFLRRYVKENLMETRNRVYLLFKFWKTTFLFNNVLAGILCIFPLHKKYGIHCLVQSTMYTFSCAQRSAPNLF